MFSFIFILFIFKIINDMMIIITITIIIYFLNNIIYFYLFIYLFNITLNKKTSVRK